ncbi:hypothetical protein LPJ71_004732, partial [Coemansia sp. S17]
MEPLPSQMVSSIFQQSTQIQPTSASSQEKNVHGLFESPPSSNLPSSLFSNSSEFHSTAALTQSILASASASQYTPMSTANGQYPGKLSLSIPGSLDANHMLLDIATDLKKEYIMDTDEDGSPTGYTGGEGSPDPSSDPYNKKRHRLRPEQTRRLLEIFEKTSKPDSEMRKVLGKQLDMTPRTVQIWFQNRRAKIKREGAS